MCRVNPYASSACGQSYTGKSLSTSHPPVTLYLATSYEVIIVYVSSLCKLICKHRVASKLRNTNSLHPANRPLEPRLQVRRAALPHCPHGPLAGEICPGRSSFDSPKR